MDPPSVAFFITRPSVAWSSNTNNTKRSVASVGLATLRILIASIALKTVMPFVALVESITLLALVALVASVSLVTLAVD